jgi:hypothetical protein
MFMNSKPMSVPAGTVFKYTVCYTFSLIFIVLDKVFHIKFHNLLKFNVMAFCYIIV